MKYYVIDYRIDGTRYRKGLYAANQTAAENIICLANPTIVHPVEFRDVVEFNSKQEALEYHDKTRL